MLFLFRGRYALPARIAVSLALLLVGVLTGSRLALVIGAVLLVITGFRAVTSRRHRGLDLDE